MPQRALTLPMIALLAAAPLLSGCIAKTALDVATAPVKMTGKAADMATTSQSESDEKRGRALRKREERLGELERHYWEVERKCRSGDDRACHARDQIAAEMDALRPTVPAGRY